MPAKPIPKLFNSYKILKFNILAVFVFSFFYILANSSYGTSQNFKQFSGKPETFISEVYKFLNTEQEDSKNILMGFDFWGEEVKIDSIKLRLKTFEISWDSSKFTSEEKEKILSISKCLVDKKIRPIPDFYQFLNIVQLFLDKEHSKDSFHQWLNSLDQYCDNKKRSLNQVLKLLLGTKFLLQDQIIYKSRSVIWKPSIANFSFENKNELQVRIEKCNLICYAKRDSIVIFNTEGNYNPVSNIWYGKTGEVTWERAGYERSIISASLNNYQIDVSKSSYEADSVLFKNMIYFDKPLMGKLEDNVTLISKQEQANFPKFDSYVKEFFLRDIFPNVNYKGGFSMQGARFIGKGTLEKPAELYFFRHDSLKLKAYSQYFIIRNDRIKGVDAAVCIYIDQDSMYHSDLQFTYTIKNKEISIMRSDNYSAQSPFMNSYHKVDMNFEQLTWRTDEPVIFITTTPGSSMGKALFESENFFNSKEYEEFQYMYDVHPLVSLKRLAKSEGTPKFSAYDFASYMHTSIENIRVLLFPLAVKGYIFYDPSTETIEMKQKLYDNISASVGRIDYDVIRFFSRTDAPLENASLDLRNNDLKINGIPNVFVSDSQNVMIYPKAESIILKRNRNFQFDGVVAAGLFTFYGKNFFFNYDDFKISLKDVDSIQMKVIIGYDNYAKPIYQKINNVIQDVTGDILIDKSDNKSGLKSNPDYPIFNSRGYSYVYYDDNSIFNGIYKRSKKFHFRIEPYELDSLDNFTKEGMHMKGQFSSAGIFPDIAEELKLQPDFSLGFKHITSAGGYPVYGGKGIFNKLIHLSNQGLRGNGDLNYLCSSLNSNDILFFPDSSNTVAQTFNVQAQPTGSQCPMIKGDTINVHWEPYKDVLLASNLKKPFTIYNTETTHQGIITVTPKGTFGNGTLDLTTAVASSKKFLYRYSTIDADTSNFTLRSLHSSGFTVITQNVNSHIDISKRLGKFKSNDSQAITEFPENRYIALLDEFTWKMDQKELDMISSRIQKVSEDNDSLGKKEVPLAGSKFISIKKDQDSLSFVSPLAIYDYEKNLLQAKKVKYIEVADARIFPDKEQLTVNPEGYITPFNNSKILANRTTRYHQIYDANVTIFSRADYGASGKYDYFDINNKKETFTFQEIKVDSFGHTIAEGSITEPDSFTLSPRFPYQGKILLVADQKYLRFDGATRILQHCPNYGSQWFLFDTVINPKEVKIPVYPKMAELNRRFIVSGTLITTDSIHIYSSFFGIRKNYSDSIVTNATGILRYNENNFSYEVAKPDKLKNRDIAGNYMRINTKTCQHYGEGIINPGLDYGQFKYSSSGMVEHDLKTNQVKATLSMSLNFFMYDKAMERMALFADSLGKSPIDIKQTKYKKNFVNLVPEETLTKYFEDIAAGNPPKEIPQSFLNNIFIDDVTMFWDDVTNSYRSKGKIGIGFIAGKPIHNYFEGYLEMWRKRSGDLFDLYIKVDENTYFYIAYTRGTLHVTSSDQVFNNMIRELPMNARTLKVGRGQMPYSFTMATERKLQNLRKRWLTGEASDEPEAEEPPLIMVPQDSIPENNTVTDTLKLSPDTLK